MPPGNIRHVHGCSDAALHRPGCPFQRSCCCQSNVLLCWVRIIILTQNSDLPWCVKVKSCLWSGAQKTQWKPFLAANLYCMQRSMTYCRVSEATWNVGSTSLCWALGKASPLPLSVSLQRLSSITASLQKKPRKCKKQRKPFSASLLVSCVPLGGFYPAAAQTSQFNSDAAHPF